LQIGPGFMVAMMNIYVFVLRGRSNRK